MNGLTFAEFIDVAGFCSIVYLVARLLHNWFNLRMKIYSDKDGHPIAGLFTAILIIISGLLYFLSLPFTAVSYFIHLGTIKMAIEADREENHEKEKEIRKIYEKIAYNDGYKEGRADGWFACASSYDNQKNFDDGQKVGFDRGYQKGYEMGWGKGYDSGYEIANTKNFDKYNVQEFEKHKHLNLVNPYTGESLSNQYDYIKFIKRKNEIDDEVQNEK